MAEKWSTGYIRLTSSDVRDIILKALWDSHYLERTTQGVVMQGIESHVTVSYTEVKE